MKLPRPYNLILWFTLLVMLAGCSGDGDPVSMNPNPEETANESVQAAPQGDESNGTTVSWGTWDVSIDTNTWQVEMVPLRSAEFTANLNQYLQPPMGSLANLSIVITNQSQFVTQGKITLDVSVTHPFPSIPDYTGFDVMGVFMHTGSLQSTVGWQNWWPEYPTDAVLLNLDGLSRWMNQTEFTTTGALGFTPGALGNTGTWTATINPYKYFTDSLGKTQSITTFYTSPSNVANRGIFKAGATNTREYQLQFPMPGGPPVIAFQYAVISRWDKPANSPPLNIPGDFPATASCQEAFYIEVRDTGSTLNYHSVVGGSGELRIDIEVFDWQGASNPSGFSNELIGLFVEGFNNWIIPPVNFSDILGCPESAGTCGNSRIYHIYLPNCIPTQTGSESLMVNAQSNNPGNYDSGFGAVYPVAAALSGYTIASIPVTNFANSTPQVPTPTGPPYIWEGQIIVFTCAASDPDPADVLTYTWSIVGAGLPAVYNIPGDPGSQNLTIQMGGLTGYPPAFYDVSCQVQDNSGAPNDTGTSPYPLAETIYVAPYTAMPPANQWDQVIVGAPTFWPTLQGMWACPSFHDGFYAPLGTVTLTHSDVTILSGPSLGMAGVMAITDEFGIITGTPSPPMRFVTYTCPYVTGNAPSWQWFGAGVPPGGPDMPPSIVHYDATSHNEYLITNSWHAGPSKLPGIPDPSAMQHYVAGTPATWLNDLYTSLPSNNHFDIAADVSNGFDHGTPSNPDTPPLYGLYTQDWWGILGSCFGPPAGNWDANPVTFLMFPSMGAQPVGTPVDAGGPGVVARLPQILTSTSNIPMTGIFSIGTGGPSPSGGLIYPDPYYALAVDDDPSDNPWTSQLPGPVQQWTLVAAIDATRDLEIYEIDFGQPTPAPILTWSSLPMGSFMNGNNNAFPVDCEFISNYSAFGGGLSFPQHAADEDLLAVLLTDPIAGIIVVQILSVTPIAPMEVAVSAPLPIPAMNYGIPGVCYSLDVDEVTGDIYVLHESLAGGGGLGVTIWSY